MNTRSSLSSENFRANELLSNSFAVDASLSPEVTVILRPLGFKSGSMSPTEARGSKHKD